MTVLPCRTPLSRRVWQSSPPATFQHWESPQLCRLQLLHPRKLRWNRLDPRIRQTIKSHLAYVNLTDAFFKQRFYQFQRTVAKRVRPAHADAPLRGDMRGCYGRVRKKLAEGGSAFLGAQADFCPRRPTAWRQAKPAS